MHDRLRLNVAVSKLGEVYSWRGEQQSSSSDIGTIVHGGPISSGNFVGFLRNVFLAKGVDFTYRGPYRERGSRGFRFDYSVPQPVSRFLVKGGENKSAIVAYHGSFTADQATFQLIKLQIIADDIPPAIGICTSSNEVLYQFVPISGTLALIPRFFRLELSDRTHIDTVSKSEYADCHEFQVRSTLRFDGAEKTMEAGLPESTEAWVPANILLKIALIGKIDEKRAFTGDEIQGRVIEDARDHHDAMAVPAGALVRGVISQLQRFYVPQNFCAVQIQFTQVSFGGKTYRMRTVHDLSSAEKKDAKWLLEEAREAGEAAPLRAGVIAFHAPRVVLDSTFQGTWRTLAPKGP